MIETSSDPIYEDLCETLSYFGLLGTGAQPVNQGNPSCQALPYRQLTQPPLAVALWDLPMLGPVNPSAEPDLYSLRVEQRVARLTETIPGQQEFLRKLLLHHPHPRSRRSIEELLLQGAEPEEIWEAHQIRRRCRSLLLEFNRLDVFGPRFCLGSHDTISWRLAHQFYRAGVISSLQLFHYFRELHHHFERNQGLRMAYSSMLRVASELLPASASALSRFRECAELSATFQDWKGDKIGAGAYLRDGALRCW